MVSYVEQLTLIEPSPEASGAVTDGSFDDLRGEFYAELRERAGYVCAEVAERLGEPGPYLVPLPDLPGVLTPGEVAWRAARAVSAFAPPLEPLPESELTTSDATQSTRLPDSVWLRGSVVPALEENTAATSDHLGSTDERALCEPADGRRNRLRHRLRVGALGVVAVTAAAAAGYTFKHSVETLSPFGGLPDPVSGYAPLLETVAFGSTAVWFWHRNLRASYMEKRRLRHERRAAWAAGSLSDLIGLR